MNQHHWFRIREWNESTKDEMRKIKVPWNQRNIDRITKWLGLEHDIRGFFHGRYSGYKSASPDSKFLYFYLKKQSKQENEK